MTLKETQYALKSGETVTYKGTSYKVTAVIARYGKQRFNTSVVPQSGFWYQAELTDPRRLVDGIPPSLVIANIEALEKIKEVV